MLYIHGLILALLLAFFASPALAQESCQEMRVVESTYVVGKGWKLNQKDAYVGSTYTQNNGCYETVSTVVDWSASQGCKVGVVQTKTNAQCSGSPVYTHPASWGNCQSAGFGLQTRSLDKEPFNQAMKVGYFLVGGNEGEDMDKFIAAATAFTGQKICVGGKRHFVIYEPGASVTTTDDCYTIAGKERCMTEVTYNLTPTCEVCQVGDLSPDFRPPVPDTDGDADPDNTDPDIDGDGEPNNSDPDADGDGNPDGGGGGSTDTDGDGIPDDTDPDDDNDGCPDGQTCPPDPDPKPDADGDGIPDDTDTDDDNNGCLDVNEPCTPGQDSDGDGVPDSTDTDDDNDGCLDVNEPCAGSGGDGDGQCDPATENCDGTPGSFGGTCAAGFSCQGDAIQCAIAREIHMNNCKLYGDDDDPGSTFNQAKGGTDGFDPEELRNSAEQVNVGTFNQSGFGWSRACPADPSIQLAFAGGAEFTIPFSRVCGPLGILSLAGVGITLLGCMVWVLGGRKS